MFKPRCGTHCAGNHVIGISFGFVFGTFAFLTGFEHIVECGLHLLGRTHTALLQVDTDHFDTHVVMVEYGLHDFANTRGDLLAVFRQGRIHAHLANHFAHCCFGRLHHRVRRVFAFEQIGACISEAVLHSELDFDNVFIFGQHGRFAQTGGFDDGVPPDIQ